MAMERVKLGRTGIEVSKLGIGTGTAHPSGSCKQALMDKNELADLLVFAFERGINFWDTAFMYKTYPHIREALKRVRRPDVVIATKLIASGRQETIRDIHASLKDLDTDYIDVCLLHGVRTERELQNCSRALKAMVGLKKEGKIRAVGLSSHGLSALRAVPEVPELDLVWARVNYSGLFMDTPAPGLYDRLASIPWLKKTAASFLPERMRSSLRPDPESRPASKDERREVENALEKIHGRSKGVVGMKVMAEGRLGNDPRTAIRYVMSLPFVDSFIIGMLSRREIEENCGVVERR